ncbi:glycerophosphoryl diester phosphodiesterase [Celerinatantimonas diazotrophica]|uniref:Glycerophosphoryl diester phosphodiesterase n=1 Tax=Celerinatantimonas diazotrophica TaxID=412034 RepID=A0A4R1J795_9GAMM|nr:glycerophosphoryl diester phosphodiesterase [Celerinatantimonas diazotrophica]TCK46332.1 glycerophosphoryl diester phosphodiesterase [Celerinatantimonas diazotrophica]CAG9295294.1 Glycerophosphodiester phosphodiesterase, cytoplasmic [Celerinatantimonas diazotrophica]
MRLAGHRGLAALAPENTLAGARLAALNHIGWVEFDVQLSADHVPVIIHDETVQRCSNGTQQVRQLSWQQLQELDFGSWFSPKFEAEKIPSLTQLLTVCRQYNLSLNLELKLYPQDDIQKLCEVVAQTIITQHFAPDRLIISSFEHEALRQIKRLLPNIRRGHLWDEIPDDWAEQLSQIDAFSVHCNYQKLDKVTAQAIKRLGYELYTYTPNDPTQVRQQWDWGVDMVISDQAHLYRISHF